MGLATGPGDPLGELVIHDNDTPCAACQHPMGAHWKRNPKCSECSCQVYRCSEKH